MLRSLWFLNLSWFEGWIKFNLLNNIIVEKSIECQMDFANNNN